MVYDDAGVVGLAAAFVAHDAEGLLHDVGGCVLTLLVQLHLLHEGVHVPVTSVRRNGHELLKMSRRKTEEKKKKKKTTTTKKK